MLARRIAEVLLQIWLHGLQHEDIEGRCRVVIQVDRFHLALGSHGMDIATFDRLRDAAKVSQATDARSEYRHAAVTAPSRRLNARLIASLRAYPCVSVTQFKEGSMRNILLAAVLTSTFAVFSGFISVASADRDDNRGNGQGKNDDSIQLGPRPFYLVDGMDEGPLKSRLMQCKSGPFSRTDFSIGHRGAALQFPEHTKEAYEAGARMGAGIVDCEIPL